jgi:uncharacterized membrane protein
MPMKPDLTSNKTLSIAIYILYLLFFTSLVFSFRAISSISIGLILLTGIFFNKQQTGSFLSGNLKKDFYRLLRLSIFYSSLLPFSIAIMYQKTGDSYS